MSSKREGRRASLESRLPHDLLKGRLPRRDSRDRLILSLEDGDGALVPARAVQAVLKINRARG
jgi:hypothetical protein